MIVHRPEAPTLQRHPQRLIARFLALALLVAQFGAEAHAYSHLAKDPDGAPNATQYCTKCLSFAHVTIAASGAPHAVPNIRTEPEAPLTAATAPLPARSPCSSYQPRAPPQFL